jgi:hypothetical protein
MKELSDAVRDMKALGLHTTAEIYWKTLRLQQKQQNKGQIK